MSVKEHSVLMSAPMVKAILEGRKVQTRRKLKFPVSAARPAGFGTCHVDIDDSGWFAGWADHPDERVRLHCPYGVPGDRLVFLCSWATEKRYDETKPTRLPETARIWTLFDGGEKPAWCGRMRPGRFLPKRLRSILPRGEVTSIRAERLQAITADDARAEGFTSEASPGILVRDGKRQRTMLAFFDPIHWFAHLWCAINGPDSWKANPYVWVVGFRMVTP